MITIASMPVYEVTTKTGYKYLSLQKGQSAYGDKTIEKDTLWNIIYEAKFGKISKEDLAYLLEQLASAATSLQIITNLLSK